MNERTETGIKLILSHIVLMVVLLLLSATVEDGSFLIISISQTILIILYLSGYWEFFGLKFRNVFALLAEIVLISIFYWKLTHHTFGFNLPLILILSIIQVYLLVEFVKILIVIYQKSGKSVDIVFPFREGVFLVTDGGHSRKSRLMNYHYYSPVHRKNKTNRSMLFATDMVKLSGGPNFLSKKNKDYPIFGENVYSPIDGIVVKVENTIPDNEPFSGNYPYNTGNTVVIRSGKFYLLMGHLKRGSIVVKSGDKVRRNDLIGEAGNSGWTERPHLHMQLMESDTEDYWHGRGICMTFKGKNMYKNRKIEVPVS